MFEGFTTETHDVDGARLAVRIGGDGPPVLLLHGYPQTGAMWHATAAALARRYTVVVPDLRGYGRSEALEADFSFRAMARDGVQLMTRLGHDRFAVVGHDRGARTAHRMALDHGERLTSVALLDILPTLEVWRTMDAWLARRYFHWLFLSQPAPLPDTLIQAEPLVYLDAALGGLGGESDMFHDEALAEYREAARRPDVVAAWCHDYRAAATTDVELDEADEGRVLDHPCLVLWGTKGFVAHHVDPLEAWRRRFAHADGHAVDAGHFLVEERPEEVLRAIEAHLDASDSRAG